MRVEVTEERLKDAGYDLSEGDTVTVPDSVGTYWCDNGWARDLSGTVASASRVVRGQTVRPDSAKIGTIHRVRGG